MACADLGIRRRGMSIGEHRFASPGAERRPAGAPATPCYVGQELPFGRAVWVHEGGDRRLLPAYGDDPMIGFAWGHGGTGARELARAVLLHVTANPALAERLCRDFTWEVLVHLPRDAFRLDRSEVLDWVGSQDSGRRHEYRVAS